jgi:tRNA(Ile)-lysidine synthase
MAFELKQYVVVKALVDAVAASLPADVNALSTFHASTIPVSGLAVGFSGGADSAMLAVAASHYAREHQIPLTLFHIHHGLVDTADEWAKAAHRLGELLDVAVDVSRVNVASDTGLGIEAAARDARYEALAALARQHGVSHILLAHHRDDQAETVMLRLLRGTGLAGMSAMAASMRRDGIQYVRPWLDIERSVILSEMERFTRCTGWLPVQDPTNIDARYTRAAVRTLLAPVLDLRWTGWRAILARHARHVGDALQILDEVARDDFATLAPSDDGLRFSLALWRRLSQPRQALVLRYWLSINGARMPSDARLSALMGSLNELHALGHDRQLVFDHADHRIRCIRGEVILEPRHTETASEEIGN